MGPRPVCVAVPSPNMRLVVRSDWWWFDRLPLLAYAYAYAFGCGLNDCSDLNGRINDLR